VATPPRIILIPLFNASLKTLLCIKHFSKKYISLTRYLTVAELLGYNVYNTQGLPKVWKPLNNFCKLKISKNGKIHILIYQKSYSLIWIPIISHPQVRRGKKKLKILNWTKGRVGAHLKGLLITNTFLKFQVVTTPPFKMAAAQMSKFHALSVIQDQLRGSGMNLIPCVCGGGVRARACVCVRVYTVVRLNCTRRLKIAISSP